MPLNDRQIFPNRMEQEQHVIASVLAKLSYHVHPMIVSKIQTINADTEEKSKLARIFPDGFNLENWMYPGSACVFPGVRRFVGRLNPKDLLKYVPDKGCIIDDNRFPRHLWTYIAEGESYNGSRWKNSGLADFELAHIFSHKPNERALEQRVFQDFDVTSSPYGLFSCASNVALIPKGLAKPTDSLPGVRIAFFIRHIELYGISTLPGCNSLRKEAVPNWYQDLEWNEPVLPANWESRIEKLMKYRFSRLTKILASVASS